MTKVIQSLFELAIVIVMMLVSCTYTYSYIVMADEGIVEWNDDKTALSISSEGLISSSVFVSSVPYITENGDLDEMADGIVYDCDKSYSGMDILLSMYLADELNPEPSCIGFAKDITAVNNLDFQIAELNDAFCNLSGKSTLNVFREDLARSRILYNNLNTFKRDVNGVNKTSGYFNRLAYLPAGFKSLDKPMWVYYNSTWADESTYNSVN